MSEERFTFPVRDDARIARRRRRQALGRRQAPAAPAAPSSESEDGADDSPSSDDEAPAPSSGAQPQTAGPQPTSSIGSSRNIITMTAILPPAQSSLLPGFVAPTSSSASTTANQDRPTLTAILPPAQSSLSTQTSSSTTQTSAPPTLDTSLKENRPESPPTSSTSSASASLPLSRSSNPVPTTSAPAVAPVGFLTSASLAITTATTLISSSVSSESSPATGRVANALGETSEAPFQGTTSKNPVLSKAVETVIIVVSVGAFFGLLGYFAYMYYRKSKARKTESDSMTNNTRSLWGGSESNTLQGTLQGAPPHTMQGRAPQMSSILQASSGPLPTYSPPAPRQQAPNPDENPFADPEVDPRRRSALTNNAAERQERLGRVRADLLAPRELTGGLMRGVPQNQGNLSDYPPPLRRPDNSWPEDQVDVNEMPPNQRLDNEAGGQWDDSRTASRYSNAYTERSMPHWRTPSQWVNDQATRSQGMIRPAGS